MPADPHWTAYLSPVIQFFTAIAAVLVAYKFGAIQAGISKQQAATAVSAAQTAAAAAQTARNRLKFDLFERRLVMYDRVYAYIDTVVAAAKLHPDTDSEFLASVRAMGWLTDKAVVEYVHRDLRGKMSELSNVTHELESTPSGQRQMDLLIKQSLLLTNLYQEHEALARVFEPFLKLEH
ncbi:hypothetical protein [Variovorax sp. W6]|uniref:hypothetical protein n=1 Tax=Variovorax sp. W6 TaxID=3093895 RepID=UPI003D804D92